MNISVAFEPKVKIKKAADFSTAFCVAVVDEISNFDLIMDLVKVVDYVNSNEFKVVKREKHLFFPI